MDYRKLFLSTSEVAALLLRALKEKKPYSLVRVGDGEARVLAHGLLFPAQAIPRVKIARLKYAGVELPDPRLRNKLIANLKKADIVGLSSVDGPGAYPLIKKILSAQRVPLWPESLKRICDAYIHLNLYREGLWADLWRDRKILLVGRRAEEATRRAKFRGGSIVGWVNFEGCREINKCLARAKDKMPADLVLVSGGISAVILCPQFARRYGVVAIDFGHIMDHMIAPDTPFQRVRILSRELWQESKRGG